MLMAGWLLQATSRYIANSSHIVHYSSSDSLLLRSFACSLAPFAFPTITAHDVSKLNLLN